MRRVPLTLLTVLILLSSCGPAHRKTLELGIFSGSSWNAPNLNTYAMMDEIIALFEEENPRIHVTYKSGIIPSDYSEWLAQRIMNDELPDLFFVLPEDFTTLASIGVLEELNREELLDSPEGIYRNVLDAGSQKGRLLGIPFEINPTFMFVNKTLLAEEGLEYPSPDWTWEEFLDYCTVLTKDRNGDGYTDQFGVDGFHWTQAVFSNGETLFSEDGSDAYLNTEGMKEAVRFLSSLRRLDEEGLAQDFDSGVTAFSPFTYSTYRTYGYYPYSIIKFGGFEWDTTLMPRGPGGTNAVDLKVLLLSVNARSRRRKEALSLLQFIANDRDAQGIVLKYGRGLPLRKDVLSSDAGREILMQNLASPDKAIAVDTIVKTVENSVIVPRFRRYETTLSLIDNQIAQIPWDSVILNNDLSRLNRIINDELDD
ncbi:MAG: extracellular solute-binding protein [Spirochaetales bacterium]|nr:extracellular solute-binding protein [Spirochaetales bacterium]